jgi:hypothetical protein
MEKLLAARVEGRDGLPSAIEAGVQFATRLTTICVIEASISVVDVNTTYAQVLTNVAARRSEPRGFG